ncbi:RHS repeat-associated core domain-containing protein [Pseudomonas cremoricolorata]|uniref:RHS repeat-associated core domain-containing protein n=1 Tax=Pseudomonas cremoricolorata TaxID=157783 RepID=UPI0009DCD260
MQYVSYTPYGFVRELTGTVGFSGNCHLNATAIYFLGTGHHRPYDTTTLRFLSPDSSSPFSEGGLNSYAYCAGDPVNYSDPSGYARQPIVSQLAKRSGVADIINTRAKRAAHPIVTKDVVHPLKSLALE